MDSNYPNRIDNFQTKENEQGAQYDPQETTVQFAEDINKTNGAIRNVQETLGTNPAGDYNTVGEAISAVDLLASKPPATLTKFQVITVNGSGGTLRTQFGAGVVRIGDETFYYNLETFQSTITDGVLALYLTTNKTLAIYEGYFDELMELPTNNVLFPIAEIDAYYANNKTTIRSAYYFEAARLPNAERSFSRKTGTTADASGLSRIGSVSNIYSFAPGQKLKITFNIPYATCPEDIVVCINDDLNNAKTVYFSNTDTTVQSLTTTTTANYQGQLKIAFLADVPAGTSATVSEVDVICENMSLIN